MGQVVAGAGGGGAVDQQPLTAVGGPVAPQGVQVVLPEGTLGHVGVHVDRLDRGSEQRKVGLV